MLSSYGPCEVRPPALPLDLLQRIFHGHGIRAGREVCVPCCQAAPYLTKRQLSSVSDIFHELRRVLDD
ncbi:hypothetical protein E2C01_041640 [Portunus trituberculatus]|uniref:Uncharacterized protein n=1 Tax=Portunus trituberculatus TaxID=210409 RepID=A0A5B7FRG7_PORTR|nr:hypothetical protein [Portunus trituberculatus]